MVLKDTKMAYGNRCGNIHPPERNCKNCGAKMNYIFTNEEKELEPFRAWEEHAWVCPTCHHIERTPM